VNTWQQTWKQLVASWNSFTTSQRAACLGGCGLMVFVLGGVAWWSSRPEYATLVNRLSPTETAEVVAALEAEQISYQLNFAASAVSVSKASLAQARLTIKDQLGLSPADAETQQGLDLFADPSQIHQRLLRQQESRLARSISQFRSVKSAVVHLSKPASSTFLRDATPATASVIVELKPGAQLTSREANTIVSLVSHGVEGLRAEDVSVMDTEGRLLTETANSANSGGDVVGQLEYRRRFETELSIKAETMLGEMLGAGRSIVRVTADIDFTATETQQTTFDPEGKVKVSETTRSESTTGKPRAGGVAGVSGNLPQAGSAGTTDSSTLSKVEENETQYANTETKNTVREAPGKIRRITVAAVVDLTPPDGVPAATIATVTQADVERIVKQAVGFDTRRNDEIEVLVSKIATFPDIPTVLPSAIDWEHWLRTGSLGVGALVALLISWLALRRRQTTPSTAPTESSASLPVAMAHRVHQVSEQALRNPQAAAAVLQAWLKSESSGTRTEILPARRRAA